MIFFRSLLLFALFTCSCTEKKDIPDYYLHTKQPLNWEEKQPCELSFSDSDDGLVLRGKFKLRGGSSSKYFKHSFSLELEDKHKLAGLHKDDDWILNANYIDKTFMRHKISYDLFRQMNSKNIAAECAYINLHLNRSYEGLYVLMEEINGGMVNLDKGDSAAVIYKDPPIFYENPAGQAQDSNNVYHQKYPKIYIHDKSGYIKSFRNFLIHSSDKEFDAQIRQWVDLENVMDWHLLLLYTNNGDGVLKNFYLYKKDGETPFRFAIWDYDHSFGRDGDNERNMMDRPPGCDRSILFKRLNERVTYREDLAERYWQLRDKGIFSLSNFKDQVANNHEIIRDHIGANASRWPLDSEWYYDNNTYEQELELMCEFVELRISQLDSCFER